MHDRHQKPRAGLSQRRCGLDEQALGLVHVTDRQGYGRQSAQCIPDAPRHRQRAEHSEAARKPVTGSVEIADRMVDVPQQISTDQSHRHVACEAGDGEGTREPGISTPQLPLRVQHQRRPDERSRLGGWRKRRHTQGPFVPLEPRG